MAKRISSKTAAGIASLVVFPVAMIVVIAPLLICEKIYPVTAIGTEGLEQVKQYCLVFVLSHVISMLLIPILFWLHNLICRALSHEGYLSRKVRIIIDVPLMALYILGFPRVSEFDLQAMENGYTELPVIQSAMLYSDISKDLKTNESICKEHTMTDLQIVSFTYQVRKSRRSFSTRTVSHWEYGLYDESGNLLGQIARKDYNTLEQGMFTYLPHSVEIYPNSGLIKSIDGKEFAENQPIEIELEFDYDAGVLRRELLCEEEELLPEMRLWTTMDGEYAGGHRINGMTEIRFKPMVPGHAEAWVELRMEGKAPVIISNIIEYDQAVYVDDIRFYEGAEE